MLLSLCIHRGRVALTGLVSLAAAAAAAAVLFYIFCDDDVETSERFVRGVPCRCHQYQPHHTTKLIKTLLFCAYGRVFVFLIFMKLITKFVIFMVTVCVYYVCVSSYFMRV